jgi:hypothetical protein
MITFAYVLKKNLNQLNLLYIFMFIFAIYFKFHFHHSILRGEITKQDLSYRYFEEFLNQFNLI